MLALVTYCLPVFATNWVCLTNSDGVSLYLDNDSVKANDYEATVLTKTMYNGMTQVARLKFNHYTKSFAFIREAVYDANGQVKSQHAAACLNYQPIEKNNGVDLVYHALWER
ncbi:hypothetical protein [uncultured Megasphaera sp.]|uniref:hypothetical protein n=1 Tax=uncultured Megasphaera sp. TaxID=165188 RepID=UPI0026708A92|nr:hypothetical protein [uncultured Megasphaera sp.]